MPSVVYMPVHEEDLTKVQEFLGELARRKREAQEDSGKEKEDVWEHMLDLESVYQLFFGPELQRIIDAIAEHEGEWVSGEDVAEAAELKPQAVYGHLSGLTKSLDREFGVDQWPFEDGRGRDGKIRYRMSPKRAAEVRRARGE